MVFTNRIYIILCVFIVVGCNNQKASVTNKNYEKAWVNAFKDKCFLSCLKESYSTNDSIFKMIEKIDLYNPYDGFVIADKAINKADSLGKNIAKNIPATNYRDYGKANYFMATCLHYYKSEELDSIAKVEYQKYLKTIKED